MRGHRNRQRGACAAAHPSRLGWRSGLLAMSLLLLSCPAIAKVVQERGSKEHHSEPAVDVGGHRIVPSGPMRLSCTQFGVQIVEGRRVDSIAVSPLSVIQWLSFRQPGARGQTVIMPFGSDTTCVLAQSADYVKRAAAAVQRAVINDQPASWSLAQAQATGRVVPTRTFLGPGDQTCRDFKQSVTIAGHKETGTGTACRQSDGDWKLIP